MKKKKQKGQSLVEYLILVALMGIATIGVIRALNHVITNQFGNIIYTLRGSSKRVKKHKINTKIYEEKDFNNFLNGASKRRRD